MKKKLFLLVIIAFAICFTYMAGVSGFVGHATGVKTDYLLLLEICASVATYAYISFYILLKIQERKWGSK